MCFDFKERVKSSCIVITSRLWVPEELSDTCYNGVITLSAHDMRRILVPQDCLINKCLHLILGEGR